MFPEDILELEDLGYQVILRNPERELRLAVSSFRENLYISLRWWNMGFDEESFYPTKEGITLPYTLDTVSRLFGGLAGLMSEAEVLEKFSEYGIQLLIKQPNIGD